MASRIWKWLLHFFFFRKICGLLVQTQIQIPTHFHTDVSLNQQRDNCNVTAVITHFRQAFRAAKHCRLLRVTVCLRYNLFAVRTCHITLFVGTEMKAVTNMLIILITWNKSLSSVRLYPSCYLIFSLACDKMRAWQLKISSSSVQTSKNF